MRPKFIIIHHTLVSRSKNSEQFDAIRRNHINKGWGSIGYHYTINKAGKIKIGRRDNEVGAHCKQMLMNWKSIGILVEGNFDIEEPTEEQMIQVKNLIAKLRKEYNIPVKNVRPHRYYAKYKSCPGEKYTQAMITDVAENINNYQACSNWAIDAWHTMIDEKIMTKNPRSNITKEELAVVLMRFAKYLKKK